MHYMNFKKFLSIFHLLFWQNVGSTAMCPGTVNQSQNLSNQSLSYDHKNSIDINQMSILDDLNKQLTNLCINSTNIDTGHINLSCLTPGINAILQDLKLNSILDKSYIELGKQLCAIDTISTVEKLFFKLLIRSITSDKILKLHKSNSVNSDSTTFNVDYSEHKQNWSKLSLDEHILLSTILMMKSSHDIYKKNITSQNNNIQPYNTKDYSQKYFAILFDILPNINQYEFAESISELDEISNALNNLYVNSKLNVEQNDTQNKIKQIVSYIMSKLVDKTLDAGQFLSIRELQENEKNILYLILTMQYSKFYALQSNNLITKKVIKNIKKAIISQCLQSKYNNILYPFSHAMHNIYTKLKSKYFDNSILQSISNEKELQNISEGNALQTQLSFEQIKVLKLSASLWEIYLQQENKPNNFLHTISLLMSKIGPRVLWDINCVLQNLKAKIKSDSSCICS